MAGGSGYQSVPGAGGGGAATVPEKRSSSDITNSIKLVIRTALYTYALVLHCVIFTVGLVEVNDTKCGNELQHGFIGCGTVALFHAFLFLSTIQMPTTDGTHDMNILCNSLSFWQTVYMALIPLLSLASAVCQLVVVFAFFMHASCYKGFMFWLSVVYLVYIAWFYAMYAIGIITFAFHSIGVFGRSVATSVREKRESSGGA